MTISIIRTIILYLLIIIALRAMGKRQVGELSPSEFVVTILVSELATIPMQSTATPLLYGMLPICALLALEILISTLFLKSRRARKLTVGKTSILIDNGKINQDEMKRIRLTIDELLEEVRLKGFIDISKVKYAILESNGELSVFPFGIYEPATREDVGKVDDSTKLPHTLIADGLLIKSELKRLQKGKAWIMRELKKRNIQSISDVFFKQSDRSGNLTIIPKEAKK